MKRIILAIICVLLLMPTMAQNKNMQLVSDSIAMIYFTKGTMQDNVLTLQASEPYGRLNMDEKKEVVQCFAKKFPDCQIVVLTGDRNELWIQVDEELRCVDRWKTGDLEMSDFAPLESRRKIAGGWFLYIGGQLSGAKDYTSMMFSGRMGTFLFKNSLNVGATFNLGYSSMGRTENLSEDIGFDIRWYLRIKNSRLAPYAGGGVTWMFEPKEDTERRLFLGLCWIIGTGSLDLGYQYGKTSKSSFTIGYTYHL